jgi:hypothetical protein
MISDLLNAVADQHMGSTFTWWAADPKLHEIIGPPAGYVAP